MMRFFARSSAADAREVEAWGPYSIEQASQLLRTGELSLEHQLRREDSTVWAPLAAWTPLNAQAAPPPRHLPERPDWAECGFRCRKRHLRWSALG